MGLALSGLPTTTSAKLTCHADSGHDSYEWSGPGTPSETSSSYISFTVSGLTPGSANTIRISVDYYDEEETCDCDDEDCEGDCSTEWVYKGSDSYSLTVYTKPSSWRWPVQPKVDVHLADVLTASNWNGMITQLGKYRSWQDQSNKYSNYNGYKVSSGDWIAATTYNGVASAIELGKVSSGDLIEANQFTSIEKVIGC